MPLGKELWKTDDWKVSQYLANFGAEILARRNKARPNLPKRRGLKRATDEVKREFENTEEGVASQ
jgi:hypothetical protein